MEEAYGGDAGRLQQRQPPDQPLAHPSVPVVDMVSLNDLGKAPGSPAANIPTSGSLPAAAPWAAQAGAGPAVGAGNHSIQPTSSVPTPALGSGQSTAWRSAAAAADPAAPPAARPSFALGAPAPWEQQQQQAWWQKQPVQPPAAYSHSYLGGSAAQAGERMPGKAVPGAGAKPEWNNFLARSGRGIDSLPALPEGPSLLGVHPPAGTPASQSSPAPSLHPAFMRAGAAGSRPAPVAAAVTAGHESRLPRFQGAAPAALSSEAAAAVAAAEAAGAAAEAYESDVLGACKVPAGAAGAARSGWMGAASSRDGVGAAAAATGAALATVTGIGSLEAAESMPDSESEDMEEVEEGYVAVKEEERSAAPAAGSGSDKSNQEGGFPAALGRMGAGGSAAGLNQQAQFPSGSGLNVTPNSHPFEPPAATVTVAAERPSHVGEKLGRQQHQGSKRESMGAAGIGGALGSGAAGAGQSGHSGAPPGSAPKPMQRPAPPSIRTLRGLFSDVGSQLGTARLAAAPVGSPVSPVSHFSAPVVAAAEPREFGSLSLMAAAAEDSEGMEIESEEEGPGAAAAAAAYGMHGWEDAEMESELEAGATELMEEEANGSDGEEGPAVGAAAAAAVAGQGIVGGHKPKLPSGVTENESGKFAVCISFDSSNSSSGRVRLMLGTYPSLQSAIKARDYGIVYANHVATGPGPAKGATYHPQEQYTADTTLMQDLRALRGWDGFKTFLRERLGGTIVVRRTTAFLAGRHGQQQPQSPAAPEDEEMAEGAAASPAAAAPAAATGQGADHGSGAFPTPKLPSGVREKDNGRFAAFVTVASCSNPWNLGTYPSLESAIKARDYGIVYINHATTGLEPAKGATHHPLEEYTADAALMQDLRGLRGWDDFKLFLKERLGGSTVIRKTNASLAAARGGYGRLQPQSHTGAVAAHAAAGGSRQRERVQQAAKAPSALPNADNHNLHQGLGSWWESGDGSYSRRCSQSTLSKGFVSIHGAVLKKLGFTTPEILLCEASGARRSWAATVHTPPSKDRNFLQGPGMCEAIRELKLAEGDILTLGPALAKEGKPAAYVSATRCSSAPAPPVSAAAGAPAGAAVGATAGPPAGAVPPHAIVGSAGSGGGGGGRQAGPAQQQAQEQHGPVGGWRENQDGSYSKECSKSIIRAGYLHINEVMVEKFKLTAAGVVLVEASGSHRSWVTEVYTGPKDNDDRFVLQGAGMRGAIRELQLGIGDIVTLRPAPAREGMSAAYISVTHCAPAPTPPVSAAVHAAPGLAAGTSAGAATPYGLMGGASSNGGGGLQPHSKSGAAAAGGSRQAAPAQQQAQEQQGLPGGWQENEDGSYSKECSRSNISKAYLSVNDKMMKRFNLTAVEETVNAKGRKAWVVLVEASGSRRSWVTDVYTGPQKDRFYLQGKGMREAMRELQLAESDTITLRPAPAREGMSAAYVSVDHRGQAQAPPAAGTSVGALPWHSSRSRSNGRSGSRVPSYKEDDSEAVGEEDSEAESEEKAGGSRQEASLESRIAKCRQWSILGDGIFGYRVSSSAISKARLSVPACVNEVWGVEGVKVDLVHTSLSGQRKAWRVHNRHNADINPAALNITAGFADVISGIGLRAGQTVELRLATAAEQPDQQVPALHIKVAGQQRAQQQRAQQQQAQQQRGGAQAVGGDRAAAAGYAFPAADKPPGQTGASGSTPAGPKRDQLSARVPPAAAAAAAAPAGAAPPASVLPNRPPGPSFLRRLLSSTRPTSPGAGAAAGGAPAAAAQPGGFRASALGPRGASTGSGVSGAAGSSAAAAELLGWESKAGGGFSREVHKEMLSTRSRITLPVPVAKSLGLLGAYKVWAVHPPNSWRWELNVAHHPTSSGAHHAKEVRLTVGVSGMSQDLNLQLGQQIRLSRHAAVDGKPAFAIEVAGRGGDRSGGDSPGQQALSAVASGTARGGQQPVAGKRKPHGGSGPEPEPKRANVQQQQQQQPEAYAAAAVPLLGQTRAVPPAPPFPPPPGSTAGHAAPAAAGIPGAMMAGKAGAGQQSAQQGPATAGARAGADATGAGGAAATVAGATAAAALGQGGPAGAPAPLGSHEMFVALRPVVNGSRAAGAATFLRMFLTRCDYPTQRAHHEHLMQLHREGQVGEIVEWVDGTVQDFARGR